MTKQKTPLKHEKTHKSDTFTFSDHIRELRRRILLVALVFMAASAISYNYHDLLVKIVMSPLDGEKLVYLTPGGGFSFIFQITLYAGLIAAGPMLMYQLYAFLRPVLPSYARNSALKVAGFATILMAGGVAYGYSVAIPAALKFLSTFAGTDIVPNLTADSYLNFFLAYVGGLALLFQLPLLLIFWHWINPMKPGGLLKSERFIILFAFVAAALITPTPDIINQAMIAIPLIGIYQIGVFVVLANIWKTRKQRKETAPQIIKLPLAIKEEPIVVHARPQTSVPSTPIATLQPHPIRQSLDGFNPRPVTRATHPQPTGPRQLNIPPRSIPREPLMDRRPMFRIDGMSPL
jgi:sec-independent protein translocase protein TatC